MFENFSNTQNEESLGSNVSNSSFVEFSSFKQFPGMKRKPAGNIFKSSVVKSVGSKAINILSHDEDQPSILVRRSGEVVETIEFSCKCGRSALVNLSYTE